MTKVFLSYRRDDSAAMTGRLCDRLMDAFGRNRVFLDIDAIGAGQDFARAVEKAIRSVDVVLV